MLTSACSIGHTIHVYSNIDKYRLYIYTHVYCIVIVRYVHVVEYLWKHHKKVWGKQAAIRGCELSRHFPSHTSQQWAPVSSFGAKNLIPKEVRQDSMTARRVFGCGNSKAQGLEGFKNYSLEKLTAKEPKVMEVWLS